MHLSIGADQSGHSNLVKGLDSDIRRRRRGIANDTWNILAHHAPQKCSYRQLARRAIDLQPHLDSQNLTSYKSREYALVAPDFPVQRDRVAAWVRQLRARRVRRGIPIDQLKEPKSLRFFRP
jgi:hypothetical protein